MLSGQMMRPEDLTDQIVRKIGTDYLATRFQTHHNSTAATMLQYCDSETNKRILSSICDVSRKNDWELRWEFLLYVYSTIDKPHGYIAENIEKLIQKAYGPLPIKEITTSAVSHGARSFGLLHEREATTAEYVTKLRNLITSKALSLDQQVAHSLRLA